MSNTTYEPLIQEHYHREATEQGLNATSTMRDQTVRAREVDAIIAAVSWFLQRPDAPAAPRLLELGCGNGVLLAELRPRFPALALTGLDYSPDMVVLAKQRQLQDCQVEQGDVRELQFTSGSFDLVVTERCIINLLDEADQDQALREIHRALAPGGVYVCIEAFTDGLENLNRAKTELGLEPQSAPYHNRWMDKEHFWATVTGLFSAVPAAERTAAAIPPENFLSSYFFTSRVLYPAVTRAEIKHNTEFVRFFGFLPPMGNYSGIQLLLLQKEG